MNKGRPIGSILEGHYGDRWHNSEVPGSGVRRAMSPCNFCVRIEGARMTDPVERNLAAAGSTTHGLEFQVKPHEIVTVRVTGTPALLQKQ
jgi:hypothetical protein